MGCVEWCEKRLESYLVSSSHSFCSQEDCSSATLRISSSERGSTILQDKIKHCPKHTARSSLNKVEITNKEGKSHQNKMSTC